MNFRFDSWGEFQRDRERRGATMIMKERDKMFEAGNNVRLVIPQGGEPEYTWGGVKNGAIGVVRAVFGDEMRVDFPGYLYWKGLVSEFELVADKRVISCDAKDCDNNNEGTCTTQCASYKKRNDDKELWLQTQERFTKIRDLASQIYLGLTVYGHKDIPGCGFCQKYHCSNCGFGKALGRCTMAGHPFAEVSEATKTMIKNLDELLKGIWEQIEKCD